MLARGQYKLSSNGNRQSPRTLLQDFERLVARLREALEVQSGITIHVVKDTYNPKSALVSGRLSCSRQRHHA